MKNIQVLRDHLANKLAEVSSVAVRSEDSSTNQCGSSGSSEGKARVELDTKGSGFCIDTINEPALEGITGGPAIRMYLEEAHECGLG